MRALALIRERDDRGCFTGTWKKANSRTHKKPTSARKMVEAEIIILSSDDENEASYLRESPSAGFERSARSASDHMSAQQIISIVYTDEDPNRYARKRLNLTFVMFCFSVFDFYCDRILPDRNFRFFDNYLFI